MATFAVFGATGSCGSALIEELLLLDDARIHAYCRSEKKLMGMFPDAMNSGRIQVFQGSIGDTDVFARCIRGCKALFLAVSCNSNTPDYHVATDTTETLLSALSRLPAEQCQLPKVVVLSSASLNDDLCQNMSSLAHWVILRTSSYIYDDLRQQERLLRAEQDWLTSIFIKPGGLAQDKKRGHKLDLEEQETFISYADLAAGMVEASKDEDGRYDMRNVTVRNAKGSGSAKMPVHLPLLCILGLITHFFPWAHGMLPRVV